MVNKLTEAQFVTVDLGDGHVFHTGRLPDELTWDQATFDAAFNLHPVDRHWIKMLGKSVQTPRWQQAYGATYSYTGSDNTALPIPSLLKSLLLWTRENVDERLNGLLLNWYYGPADYIGPHHDDTDDLVVGSPIVTISFGEQRTFRLSKGRAPSKRIIDVTAGPGAVFVTPWDTNNAWKHSVPKRTSYLGRRISVTLRAFDRGVLPPDQYFGLPQAPQ